MKKSTVLAVSLTSLLHIGVAVSQTASDVVCVTCVGTTDLAKDSVTTGKIVDGTIVSADLRDNSITGVKIRNGSIGLVDLTPELQDFAGAAIANISTLLVASSNVGVAAAFCPADRIPVSANCDCNSNDGSNNFGVLFGCSVAGTGALAGCFPEAGTFNPLLPEPIANVEALCLGAESADGTPWLPTVSGAGARSSASKESKSNGVEQAEWMKERQTAYESAMSEMQAQRAEFDQRRRQRQ